MRPTWSAAMPQLASAIASTVKATAQAARAAPGRQPPMRRSRIASSAATTAIQLDWRPVAWATRIHAAAMPMLPASASAGAMAGRCRDGGMERSTSRGGTG